MEIEEGLERNNTKKAYQVIKDLTAEKQGRPTSIQDKAGKCLTEDKDILDRWTEYCSELYNHQLNGDPAVLNCPLPTTEEGSQSILGESILREEVEAAVKLLKQGKSAGIDNIPAELVQAGGEAIITALTIICNNIWNTGIWPSSWTQSLIITLPKKGNLQQCNNYRTISLISHPSKVMLKILLNRLKPEAETIIAEEQAGFRANRSAKEQIFNLRIICEKYLQHQQHLYHVFVDFKNAFDRLWHAALWSTMRQHNINANLVRVIEQLYNKATSAVLLNGNGGNWFHTAVGVRQGCILSPTLFNIFLERIMNDEETSQTSDFLVEHLDKASSAFGMEISAEKTKLMTNNPQGITTEIKINGSKFDTVKTFKYLGSIISDEGSRPEILTRIAQTATVVSKLQPI
uniref:Reverse transcriptase domain-containing protein n=1 Tax=Hippocampus comes TaxID=109280 RepID=A0A3Q2XCC0_HIPCM